MKFLDQLNLVDLARKGPFSDPPRSPVSQKFKLALKKFIIFCGLLLVLIVLVFLGYRQAYANRVYPGVYLNQIALGNLNHDEILQLLKPLARDIEDNGLIFLAKSPQGQEEVKIKSILIAVSDPDLSRRIISFDVETTYEQARLVGRRGTIFNQIKEVLVARIDGWPIKASIQLDEKELRDNLKQRVIKLEQESHDAGFELLRNGALKFIDDKAGYFFDLDKAILETKNNLFSGVNQPIQLTLINYEPKIRTEDVKLMEDKIQETLNLAPLKLNFNQESWSVSKNLLSQWLVLQKDESAINLALDPDKITLYLNTISKDIDHEAMNARFRMENDWVIEFQPSQAGQSLDVTVSAQQIIKQILSGQNEVSLTVVMTEPEILTQEVNDLGIKELIGQGVSNFGGSPKNRRHNIAVGAKKLNGLLIKPGQEFSLVQALGEINEQAGFLPELVIKGDRTIPEFGGGLCQIGTTTFRVALYSGLPITARTPHSYRVVYYEPAGMDATIYQPQPDLRFINDTGYHILFQTKIDGDNLIFEFYGTSDGRKIEITKPKLYNIVAPGSPLEIKTLDLKPGEKKKLETAHAGADAEFTRTITYVDGATKVNTWKSHYRPWQEVWLVGVASLDETAAPVPEQLQQP